MIRPMGILILIMTAGVTAGLIGFGLAAPSPRTVSAAGEWRVAAGGWDAAGRFRMPSGLTVDGEGNLLVADTENHRIQKLSPNGEPLAQWGSYGGGPVA